MENTAPCTHLQHVGWDGESTEEDLMGRKARVGKREGTNMWKRCAFKDCSRKG